jgi:hypothetical protein
MAVNEQDMLEDLAYAEAEGPSDLLEEDGADSWDRSEGAESEEFSFAEEDMFGEGDPGEDPADPYESEEDSLFAEDGAEGDQLLGALSSVLGAEEEDEFFGKIVRAVKKAMPVVGNIARLAGPALRMIPHPAAQAAGQIANVLGKLRAEGASTEDALETVAELAVRDRRAIPVVAGLAARAVLKNRAASMSLPQRRQAVKGAVRAAQTLVQQGGPRAIRALPKVARSVRRTAAAKGTPASVRAKVLQRTAAKVAQNPRLLQKLARPSPRAQALLRRAWGGGFTGDYGGSQTRELTISGPARISINIV